jgi:hypothetical protein
MGQDSSRLPANVSNHFSNAARTEILEQCLIESRQDLAKFTERCEIWNNLQHIQNLESKVH